DHSARSVQGEGLRNYQGIRSHAGLSLAEWCKTGGQPASKMEVVYVGCHNWHIAVGHRWDHECGVCHSHEIYQEVGVGKHLGGMERLCASDHARTDRICDGAETRRRLFAFGHS